MYNPPAFKEDRPDVLAAAIRSHPLGTLITSGEGGLRANVLPFVVRPDGDAWLLRGHLAKANDQVPDLRAGADVLVMFQGPQSYVSPSWYPTKKEHGKAVPTWNYMIVQAWGAPVLHDDPAWLLDQLNEITGVHESGRADPWAVSDAPADYVEAQLRGIVGLEIRVARMAGKWKASQNQPERNRLGVIEGLIGDGEHGMADLVADAGRSRS